jgi:sulfate adenylyltransferase subunit 1 (EFTu-like GTPase family)
VDARFLVQYVNRPNSDFRGFCGTVASGVFKKGDAITALPSGKTSHVKSIVTYDGLLEKAFAGMAVTLTLTDEIDVSRGDMIVGSHQTFPSVADKFKAYIVWMVEQPMIPSRQYLIKLGTRSASCSVSIVHHRIDVNTLERHETNALKLNEIGYCTVLVNAPVVFDPYTLNQKTAGSFIIIDRLTNITLGAGMIAGDATQDDWRPVTAKERASRFAQMAAIIGLTGNNAKQIAYHLERKLFDTGHAVAVFEQVSANVLGHAQPLSSKLSHDALVKTIKNAGLLCLCVDSELSMSDIVFDCNRLGIDEIYETLKRSDVIH